MAQRSRAKRVQKPWQAIEQNQTEGRGCFERTGSNQPKPRDARVQTAHGGEASDIARHAARPSASARALRTNVRMAWRLNWKVSSADAW